VQIGKGVGVGEKANSDREPQCARKSKAQAERRDEANEGGGIARKKHTKSAFISRRWRGRQKITLRPGQRRKNREINTHPDHRNEEQGINKIFEGKSEAEYLYPRKSVLTVRQVHKKNEKAPTSKSDGTCKQRSRERYAQGYVRKKPG